MSDVKPDKFDSLYIRSLNDQVTLNTTYCTQKYITKYIIFRLDIITPSLHGLKKHFEDFFYYVKTILQLPDCTSICDMVWLVPFSSYPLDHSYNVFQLFIMRKNKLNTTRHAYMMQAEWDYDVEAGFARYINRFLCNCRSKMHVT